MDLLVEQFRTEAYQHQGDCLALLALLRALENLHREIRDTLFQESLPSDRQSLYTLLRNIEAEGGWPYVYRPKLQVFLANLPVEEAGHPSETPVPDTHSP
ncbi:hypothetical protein BST81_04875 [Leptolyngbya sp. 'hensonii']|nr:hypothetical protein BST81_04875 [Leptolyngbya sp. 'hensonii']